MRQFHDPELQQSETVAESINQPVSVEKQNGVGGSNVARIAVLSIVAIGILVLPIASLLSSRGHLLPKLPIFIGSRARPVNTGSAVLAVDAFGLSIQTKKDSAATREVLEQAAVQHLARLHRTYSRWADTNGDLMGSLLLKLTVDGTGKSRQRCPIGIARHELWLHKYRIGRCSEVEIPQGRSGGRGNNGATIVRPKRNGSGHGGSMGTQGQEPSGRRNLATGVDCRH